MQVNKVSINNNTQPNFSGGIKHNLLSKLSKDAELNGDVFRKIDDIYSTNQTWFTLGDAVYNAKEKTAEFFLTALDRVKFIPGLESVKPKVVKAKGENLVDAFKNIDIEDLKVANKSLASDYNKQYENTKAFREEVIAKREAKEAELKAKFESADGFWDKYYRSLSK